MANELTHKDPGSELTQAEYISSDGTGHVFESQAQGDVLYATSTTVLSRLEKDANDSRVHMGGSCIPAWTASPSVTDLTIGGGCITLTGAATDIDLIDNNASALSFDASGKTGIIDIVTTNCSEGVTMSGTLGVTGALTATAGITVGSAGSGADVTFHSATSGDNFLWDSSCEKLVITGTNGQTALCVADGNVVIADTLYLFDAGGEYISSNGSVLAITGATTISSTLGVTGAITANAGVVVDNFTLDGTELDLSSGDFALDVAGDIEINADGGCINFKDASLALAAIVNTSCVGELRIHEAANYIGFKAPALSANQIWTLPAADGSACTVLTTDSCGVLSWAAAGGPCQASVAAIIAATNENTYIPPDLTPCIPGVSRTAVAHCNFSISSDNTLSDQACWDIAIATDEMVAISVTAFLYLTTAADFKYTFTGPSGMQMHTQGVLINRDTGAVVDAGFEATPGTAVPMIANADTCYVLRICGGFKADSSNAGTIAFQWAQNTSDGACIHFRRQSTFQATKAYFKAS